MKLKQRPKTARNFRNAFLVCVLFMAATPCAVAQDGNVILPTRELSIKQSFEEIERQTNYKLAYDADDLNLSQRVLVSGSSLPANDLLDQMLAGTNYTYKTVGSNIVLTRLDKNFASQDKTLYSTMDSNSGNARHMTFVHDPHSPNRLAAGSNQSISGYWQTEGNKIDSLSLVSLHFRVGKSILERDFMDNAATLDIIDATFSDMELTGKVDYMTITSASSPEGNTLLNEQLAKDRALAVKSYIMWKHPYLNRDKIYTYSIGEDWSGLRKMVENDKNVPGRERVLELLDEPIDANIKKSHLKEIEGGKAYQYISGNMLPYLRGAAACMLYLKGQYPDTSVDTLQVVDTVYIEKITEIEKTVIETNEVATPHYYALKTNLLYDLALIPNVAFEFSLGQRWSMEVEGMLAWWNTNKTHKNCWRIQAGGVEVRKWLGNKSLTPLTGHYIGLYGAAGTYDVRINGHKGHLSDMSYSVGLSYGYSMPVSRSLNLEFGIGIGYMGGEYDTYEYNETSDTFPRIDTKDRHYVGPTKAKVSLVWLIGSGKNTNRK